MNVEFLMDASIIKNTINDLSWVLEASIGVSPMIIFLFVKNHLDRLTRKIPHP